VNGANQLVRMRCAVAIEHERSEEEHIAGIQAGRELPRNAIGQSLETCTTDHPGHDQPAISKFRVPPANATQIVASRRCLSPLALHGTKRAL
jgi:hypothetical protein